MATAEHGHDFHNRLTHTLKVAQVAVRLAERLLADGVDPALVDVDAVETAALVHDLGHPPFGHVAETTLNELASEWGGFEGNAQSFRIVTKLAVNKPEHLGLRLTSRSLNASLKYPWLRGDNSSYPEKWGAYDSERDEFLACRHGEPALRPSLEAQIMDWADDVTFAVHDLEDFFRSGLIPLERVVSSARERDSFRASLFIDGDPAQGLHERFVRAGLGESEIDDALAYLFEDVFAETEPFGGSREDRGQIRRRSSYLIGMYDKGVGCSESDGRGDLVVPVNLRAQVAILKQLTWHYVIKRPSLAVLQEGQKTVISSLFEKFSLAAKSVDDRVIFPRLERDLLASTRNEREQVRVVVDFVSGLTENMVYELHHRLTGVSRGSILDAAARATR